MACKNLINLRKYQTDLPTVSVTCSVQLSVDDFSLRNAVFGDQSNFFFELVSSALYGCRGRIVFEDKLKLVAMSESFASRCMFMFWGILLTEFASQLLLHTCFIAVSVSRADCLASMQKSCHQWSSSLAATNNELSRGGVFPKALTLTVMLSLNSVTAVLLMQTSWCQGKAYQCQQPHTPPVLTDSTVSSPDPRWGCSWAGGCILFHFYSHTETERSVKLQQFSE